MQIQALTKESSEPAQNNTHHEPQENLRYPTIEGTVGSTPLIRLQRLGLHVGRNNMILLKLEGNNPAGSVKDRPALSMISLAEQSGRIKPGDTLIEATSGNTGTYNTRFCLGCGVVPFRSLFCCTCDHCMLLLPHRLFVGSCSS